MTRRTFLYKTGACVASACAPADLSGEQVVADVNATDHPGLMFGWALDPAPTFATGQPNPCACEQVDGRKHWLLTC